MILQKIKNILKTEKYLSLVYGLILLSQYSQLQHKFLQLVQEHHCPEMFQHLRYPHG
jgi:hypothetical protein